VTANKELIAKHGLELQALAKENGVGLYYEASVAGGIPVIKILAESLQANKIGEIMGIINGTTNYILTKMSEEGRSFSDVLAEAQRLGYAEPDPTADIEGYDAMYKISILSSMAFHKKVDVDKIYREGITQITRKILNTAGNWVCNPSSCHCQKAQQYHRSKSASDIYTSLTILWLL